MKNYEENLKRAILQAPAPDLEELMNEPVEKLKRHDDITRQDTRGRIIRRKSVLSVCAACACLCIVVFGWMFRNGKTETYIELDINPSLEIAVNSKNQVLKLEAMNSDAKKIISNIKWRRKDVDTVVDDILDEMLQEDYFKDAENMILLSVDNKSSKKAEELMDHLEQRIQEFLNSKNVYPTIIRQLIRGNEEERNMAKAYNMSMGKLYLIKEIMKLTDDLSFEELADRSVKELTDIYEKLKADKKPGTAEKKKNSGSQNDGSTPPEKKNTDEKTSGSGSGAQRQPARSDKDDDDDDDEQGRKEQRDFRGDDDRDDEDKEDNDENERKQTNKKPAVKPSRKPADADDDDNDKDDDDDDKDDNDEEDNDDGEDD